MVRWPYLLDSIGKSEDPETIIFKLLNVRETALTPNPMYLSRARSGWRQGSTPTYCKTSAADILLGCDSSDDPPNKEATDFMQNWLFYLGTGHLECEIKYKIALIKGDSDQCRMRLLKDLKAEAAWLPVLYRPRAITAQKSQCVKHCFNSWILHWIDKLL